MLYAVPVVTTADCDSVLLCCGCHQDATLLALTEQLGKDWVKISQFLKGRTARNCSARWKMKIGGGLPAGGRKRLSASVAGSCGEQRNMETVVTLSSFMQQPIEASSSAVGARSRIPRCASWCRSMGRPNGRRWQSTCLAAVASSAVSDGSTI